MITFRITLHIMEDYMKASHKKKTELLYFDQIPEHLKSAHLVTRHQLASIWNIAVSHLDNIPETELQRVRIGRSIRFTLDSILRYINNNKSNEV